MNRLMNFERRWWLQTVVWSTREDTKGWRISIHLLCCLLRYLGS